MIKSILIPIDGSTTSDAALTIGCSISGLTQATLIGLFVEDERRFLRHDLAAYAASALGAQPVVPMPIPPEKAAELEFQLDKEFAPLNTAFERRLREASTTGALLRKRGLPSDVIIDQAKTVDFVIIGKHGKHVGVEYVEEGFTTNTLLQHTTRPVLVVPDDPQGNSVMVIAYDGSPAAERTLRAAAELALITEMLHLHLLTISTKRESAQELLDRALSYLNPYHRRTICATRKGNAHDEILGYAEEVKASILCLGAFGQNSLMSKIFGSTTSSVVRDARCALLLMA